jgi:phage baseplate assembly protein W
MVVNLLTGNSKKINLYSDFKKDLEISPLSDDLTLLKDEDAVKESIKNLILTDRGERLFQPNLGGNIKAMLFENITPGSLKFIEEQITTTIKLHEPRAELIGVTVGTTRDENTVAVQVEFYITNREAPVELSVFLERTR